ncbi:pyrolysin [Ceratobasidium sp. AG-Ba]|nr:pyrolysin [Ceratobasidium sp. AG-Ba]QRW03368.1 pyrolysin [Ceratobasidium sp. AG-Ba]
MQIKEILDAFARLEAIQKEIELAGSELRNVCVTLCHFVLGYDNSADEAVIEERLSRIDNDLGSIADIKQKLVLCRALLRRMANTSKRRVMINVLPQEVLAYIFELAVFSWPDTEKTTLIHPSCTIPSVCASWRQLAINSPSLWVNIDFYEGYGYEKLAKQGLLWFKRACNKPLNVTFHSEFRPCHPELESQISELVTRAKSFTFNPEASHFYLTDIFDLYDVSGRSDILETIAIRGVRGMSSDCHWWKCIPPCLTTLELVDLSAGVAPNLNELVALLPRCPSLHTLVLSKTGIDVSRKIHYSEIALPNLRYLKIVVEEPSVSEHLFAAIVPGSHALDLWFNLPPIDELHNCHLICRFLERARVASLCLEDLMPQSGAMILAHFLDHLPGVQSLRLNLQDDRTGSCLDALTVSVHLEEYRARCPTIRTLILDHGAFGKLGQEQVKRIVNAHNLKTLALPHSYFRNVDQTLGGGKDSTGNSEDSEKKQEAVGIYTWLETRVGNVEWCDLTHSA